MKFHVRCLRQRLNREGTTDRLSVSPRRLYDSRIAEILPTFWRTVAPEAWKHVWSFLSTTSDYSSPSVWGHVGKKGARFVQTQTFCVYRARTRKTTNRITTIVPAKP
jgi:hypothetical protein